MTDRPAYYEAMDAPQKLLWEAHAQTDLLARLVELVEPTSEPEPDSIEVSESESEPIEESVEVTNPKRSLIQRLMGHD